MDRTSIIDTIILTAAMLLLSGALSAQNGAGRPLGLLFLSLWPCRTLSCPVTAVFPLKTGKGHSNEIFDSRDVQYHIIYSPNPPVG